MFRVSFNPSPIAKPERFPLASLSHPGETILRSKVIILLVLYSQNYDRELIA
jgi:hypothetical protein